MDREFKKNRGVHDRILRFHVLKPKEEVDTQIVRKLLPGELPDEDLNGDNADLMNHKVQIVIQLTKIAIVNFLPLIDESEK